MACLGGSFFVQNGIDTTYGFGVVQLLADDLDQRGRVPAGARDPLHDDGADVSITNFGDRVVIGGHAYVAIYSRVAVHNPTGRAMTVDPQPSAGLVPLNNASDTVRPGRDGRPRLRGGVRPVRRQLRLANRLPARRGGRLVDAHFAHMQAFWNRQLTRITQLSLPDPQLVDAYKAGFVVHADRPQRRPLDTGTNGYHAEYEHDVIGILANMFNEGDFTDAHALLDEADTVVGTNGQYADGTVDLPVAVGRVLREDRRH